MKTIKNKIAVIFVYLSVILLSLISISSCAYFGHRAKPAPHPTQPAPTAAYPTHRPTHRPTSLPTHPFVKAHLWDYQGEETEGYAMYTYVVYGRSGNRGNDFYHRYYALMEFIQSSTESVHDFSSYGIDFDKSHFNLFIIDRYDGSEYLAITILTKLSSITNNDKFRKSLSNPGPFLISIKKPIGVAYKDRQIDEVLYVDLTNTNDTAIEEVVMAYKNRLVDDNVTGTSRFNSFKLILLDLMLDTDDYITIVKTAYADILPDLSK